MFLKFALLRSGLWKSYVLEACLLQEGAYGKFVCLKLEPARRGLMCQRTNHCLQRFPTSRIHSKYTGFLSNAKKTRKRTQRGRLLANAAMSCRHHRHHAHTAIICMRKRLVYAHAVPHAPGSYHTCCGCTLSANTNCGFHICSTNPQAESWHHGDSGTFHAAQSRTHANACYGSCTAYSANRPPEKVALALGSPHPPQRFQHAKTWQQGHQGHQQHHATSATPQDLAAMVMAVMWPPSVMAPPLLMVPVGLLHLLMASVGLLLPCLPLLMAAETTKQSDLHRHHQHHGHLVQGTSAQHTIGIWYASGDSCARTAHIPNHLQAASSAAR